MRNYWQNITYLQCTVPVLAILVMTCVIMDSAQQFLLRLKKLRKRLHAAKRSKAVARTPSTTQRGAVVATDTLPTRTVVRELKETTELVEDGRRTADSGREEARSKQAV